MGKLWSTKLCKWLKKLSQKEVGVPGESALLTVMLALVVSVPSSFLAMQV